MIDFHPLEHKTAPNTGADDGIEPTLAEALAAGGAHADILADATERFREIEGGFGALEGGSSR